MSILTIPFELKEYWISWGLSSIPVIIILIICCILWFVFKKTIEEKIKKHVWMIVCFLLCVLLITSLIVCALDQYPKGNSFRVVISPFQIIESSSKQNDYDIATPDSIKSIIEEKQKNVEVILLDNDIVTDSDKAKKIAEKYDAHIVLYGKSKSAYFGKENKIDCSVFMSDKIKNRNIIEYRDNVQNSISALSNYKIREPQDIQNFEGNVDDVVYLILGLDSFFSEDYKSSILFLTNVSKQSYNSDTYVYLGIAQKNENLIDASYESFNNSLILDPTNFYAWAHLGRFYQNRKNYSDSIYYYDKSIKLNFSDSDVFGLQGANYLLINDTPNASFYFYKSLDINPNNSQTLENLGAMAYVNKNLSESEKYNLQAVKVNPTSIIGWGALGQIYLVKQDFNSSLNAFDRSLAIDKNRTSSWILRGIVLKDMGKYDEALISFDKAIEIDPTNGYAWYMKGITYFNMWRYSEAINCFERYNEIKPKYYLSYVYIGECYGNLKEWDMAEQTFNDAIKIDPTMLVANRDLEILDLKKRYSIDSYNFTLMEHYNQKNNWTEVYESQPGYYLVSD